MDLGEFYRDLHQHPELSEAETRTAGLVAERLTALGYETTPGVGGTGVVAVLRNGDGPTALLRADMDALPVAEETGLPYASTARTLDRDGHEVGVMHACGHDVHVACLVGAAEALAADTASWRGTAMLVFQPAEEVGTGAQAMVSDGLFERFGRPDVVLGQHVAPIPAGIIGLHPGVAFAAADGIRVTLFGRGAHGSRPETSVDPVVMAAATVLRLQGVVSREIAAKDTAVLTVGSMRAGVKSNVIPADAELLLSLRTFDPAVREAALAAVRRIVAAEAAASGAPKEPEVVLEESFPPLVNDPAAIERTRAALEAVLGAGRVVDPGVVTGSEDVGAFATEAGVPLVYWLLGGADPKLFAGAATAADMERIAGGLPSNHSPLFAPVIDPTLRVGVTALVTAAREWMPAS
ncbi:amidohydrolase [Actinoplanes sp. CA-142083]|uniref:amidohydrolase n=1 Tax=Actinoplanes sp. CA-142083 TaxID=3239903 RepID=UPI003D8B50A4